MATSKVMKNYISITIGLLLVLAGCSSVPTTDEREARNASREVGRSFRPPEYASGFAGTNGGFRPS